MDIYKKNSVGRVIGFNRFNKTGKKYGLVNINDDDNLIINGIDTKFKKDFEVGSYIFLCTCNLNMYPMFYKFLITDIESNTELTVSENTQLTDSSIYYEIFSSGYISDFRCDFSPNNYISLKIPTLNHIDAQNTSLKDSFAIIPSLYSDNLNNDGTQLEIVNIENNKYSDTKYFSNPKRLNDLRINFVTYDGELYDFQGLEHRLIFNITCLKQSSRYLYAIN